MNQIQTSLDWQRVSANMHDMIRNLKYDSRSDISLMLGYVNHLVGQLSSEEINCRRLHKQTRTHKEILEKINNRLVEIEQLITFATLLN